VEVRGWRLEVKGQRSEVGKGEGLASDIGYRTSGSSEVRGWRLGG
jgi:hypothetical protein